MLVSDRKAVFHHGDKKRLFSAHLSFTSEESTIIFVSFFVDKTEILWCLFEIRVFMASV